MTKGIIAALSNPLSPDVIDAYQAWYTDTHLPQICEHTGITDIGFYRAASDQPFGDSPRFQFMVLYHVDDVADAIARIRAAAPKLDLSDYFDPESFASIAFNQVELVS